MCAIYGTLYIEGLIPFYVFFLKIKLLDKLFNTLHSLGNLLIVAADNIPQVIKEEQLVSMLLKLLLLSENSWKCWNSWNNNYFFWCIIPLNSAINRSLRLSLIFSISFIFSLVVIIRFDKNHREIVLESSLFFLFAWYIFTNVFLLSGSSWKECNSVVCATSSWL